MIHSITAVIPTSNTLDTPPHMEHTRTFGKGGSEVDVGIESGFLTRSLALPSSP